MIWLNPIMALATPEYPWIVVMCHHSVFSYKRKPRLKRDGRAVVRDTTNRGEYRGEFHFLSEQFEEAKETELRFGHRFLLIKGET